MATSGTITATIPISLAAVGYAGAVPTVPDAQPANSYTFTRVQAQLNDLPATFKRPNAPYLQLTDALTAPLADYTEEAAGIFNSLTFSAAQYGWLDTWGILFAIPRNAMESDIPYAARILATLNAWVGTLPAIQAWIQFTLGLPATVAEGVNGGYSIAVAGSPSIAQQIAFFASLLRIRPAGVPYGFTAQSGGLYLSTINYLGAAPSVAGAYLAPSTKPLPGLLGAVTNNTRPLMPTTYLTDPTLNPVFAG